MNRLIIHTIVQLFLCLLLFSCSGTKYLPQGEKLFAGADIKIESNEKLSKKEIRMAKSTAKSALHLIPNKHFLGIRPKLWKYMTAGETPKTKYKKWLKKSGEPPVLLSATNPQNICSIIDAQLFNHGIFKSFTEYKIIEKKHSAKILYISHIHKPYTIKELLYAISDDSLQKKLITEKDLSLLKNGDDFNLETLKNERNRIDSLLKDIGYFYFNPDYLLFKADTSDLNHTVTLKLSLKDSIPKNALTIYRIRNVYIDQRYSINSIRSDTTKSSIKYENTVFLGNENDMKIRPKVIAQSVYFKKDELYSRRNHNITLNRLMTMGDFKFVSVKISESDTSAAGFLDVTILMTPMTKRSFRAEIDIVTKSNSYTGPRLNISLLNRNTFKGAELLQVNIAGSYETQINGKNKALYSYSLNPQIELTLPQFLTPFPMRTNSLFVPKTHFLLSYNYLKKVSLYDLSTVQFAYGYKWKANSKTEHELNPIMVSYTSIAKKTDAFNLLLASNPFLKTSFEEQFIAGITYSYTYNELGLTKKKQQYFFQLASETAGNTFSLAKTLMGEKISSNNPSRMFGSIYSQYARLSLDGRVYYNVTDKSKLAMRLFAGIARSYGNTSILPYTKQFFSGGPNSIRAFRFNSLGPGNYQQNTKDILQLGGDVKLELNVEYRFPIFGYLKGAFFTDAGNVWLLQSNPADIGNPFSVTGFINDVAVGAGFGLRLDVSFFILRFDIATPLRKPWLADNNRWVIDKINLGNSSWRNENLFFNVAIGYPF